MAKERSEEAGRGTAVAPAPAKVPALKTYWIGLVENPFFEYVTVAGLDVCRFTQRTVNDPVEKEMKRIPELGRLFRIRADYYERFAEVARRKMVRPGPVNKLVVHDGSTPPPSVGPFLDEPNQDIPLSTLIYCVEWDPATMSREMGSKIPDTIDPPAPHGA